MHVTYSQELKDYMARKGYTNIEVGLAEAGTCCSGYSEIVAGFVTDKGAERIRKKVVRRLPGEVGEVLITSPVLEIDDDVELGLRNFLGLKDITVKGIRAWSL
jgi:hypothetical protein